MDREDIQKISNIQTIICDCINALNLMINIILTLKNVSGKW